MTSDGGRDDAERADGVAMKAATIAFMVIVLGLMAAMWAQAEQLRYPSDVFPKLVFVIIAALAVLIIVAELWSGHASTVGDPLGWDQPGVLADLGVTLAMTIAYVVAMYRTGFYVTTWGFLFVLFVYPGARSALRAGVVRLLFFVLVRAAFAVLLTALVYGSFRVMLKVPTPQGMFF